jgi:hypothetical protein
MQVQVEFVLKIWAVSFREELMRIQLFTSMRIQIRHDIFIQIRIRPFSLLEFGYYLSLCCGYGSDISHWIRYGSDMMQIRIRPFNLLRIRILGKGMQTCHHWHTDPPRLHFCLQASICDHRRPAMAPFWAFIAPELYKIRSRPGFH